MRGARTLRLWMLFHCVALLPYSIVVALSASTKSPDTAAQLYRFGASFIPLAAAAGTGFQLALIRKYRRYRVLVWLGMVTAGGWVIVGSLTDAAISGVHRLPVGLWSPNAGPWAPIALVHTVLLSIGGFTALTRAALDSRPSEERRQLRLALVANLVTYAGLVDVLMAYGIGTFPVGWLLSGIGSLLLLRAILVEDLLRVRAVDTSVPRLVAHFAVAVLLVWVALARVGTSSTWWGTTATILQCFLGVRVAIAIVGLFNRGARESYGGPLDRLLAQFVTRTRALSAGVEIASLATEIVDLGLGAKSTVLLASEADWGFTLPDGTRLADDDTPDPLLGSWLVEHHRTVFSNDPEQELPADLAPMLEAFLERQRARAIVPVRSGDELVALIVVPRPGARLRGAGLAFVERLADRPAEALIHARMAVRAA
ncbi:MAG: hypothetical protein NT062_08615, partial [Proteobacteria bacterium]|nr:hypothetical protein [Pseudomonadota bacterium]